MDWTDWPGKSPLEPGGIEHPAAFHMLDVMAVAERLIKPFGFSPALQDALILLIGLHDLGKISESFRAMLREGQWQDYRHWELSEVLFYVEDARLDARLGGRPRVRQQLYAAVAGHHGQPSKRNLGGLPQQIPFPQDFSSALKAIGDGHAPAQKLIDLFCDLWPMASLAEVDFHRARNLSWWLPGLCVAADWVGSNTRWFVPKAAGPSLADYWQQARQIASVAVVEAGLHGATPRHGALFDFSLRPLQEQCLHLPLPQGPMLAIIEDETGAGKTEAALILAHRMALAGKGRGIFFALPTMATADAMFARACASVGRMFDQPSVTLAHGRAGLSIPFRDLVMGGRTGGEQGISCSGWLAHSNRRALLADVGVGTIDQVLLAVLPVKFQTLRYYGLSSKILIVDEVHDMGEPYIAAELVALLKMHRAAGGSAVLLTATLPLDLRAKLLATYDGVNDNQSYPALTVAGGAVITDFSKDDRPKKGEVKVQRIEKFEDALSILSEKSAQGAACVWVRNAVDDAIEAVDALRAKGVQAHLLHARFALYDRKRIEAEILTRVGKEGQGREGFVLVGTQVLEASLDLDFDVMISDIAPIAALVQRAGRLWRHMDIRPVSSRPVPQPVLYVLSPDPAQLTDDRWLQGTLGRGAWVYSIHDVWRSAHVLFAAGMIDAPAGLRSLMEAVYGPQAVPVPPPLQEAEIRVWGKAKAQETFAFHNIVDFSLGYRIAGYGNDDARYPTRLGEETCTLCLAHRGSDGLVPWADGEGDQAWSLSEVSAYRRKLDHLPLPDQSSPDIVALTCHWPEWKRAEIRVCPVGPDGTICDGLYYAANRGLVFAPTPDTSQLL